MSNKSSSNIDDSSSNYYEPCSNSKELNEFETKTIKNKKESSENISEKISLIKGDSKINYESPPKRSLNNNNYTSSSTGIFSSNRASNLNNNLMLSNKELGNNYNDYTVPKKSFNKKININSINSVKKKLLSPIDENANNINNDSSLYTKTNLNTMNDVIDNNKKQKIQNKFEYNNININKIKKNNNNNNEKQKKTKKIMVNTSVDKNSENSIYSSLDEMSNTTIFKKIDKIQEKDNEDDETSNMNNNSNNKNIDSFAESKIGKKSVNTISESIMNDKNYKKIELSKEDTVVFQDYSSLMINTITFEDISQDYLTVNDLKLKYNLREIPVRRKDVPDKHIFLKTLIELQIFNFGDSPIWCIKISKHGKYLAAGNKAGKIRIYEIMGYDYEKYQNEYNSKNIVNFLHFVEEKAIKEFSEHKSDITDLSWSSFKKDLLLSASVDHFVILWDISQEDNCLIEKFEHNDLVTCVQFSPVNENIFLTGCFDKYVRIYNILNYINKKNIKSSIEINNNFIIENNNKKKQKIFKESISSFSAKKIKDFFNLTDKITSVSFFPEGNQIAIGTINGKINIYDLFDQNVRYNHSFTCRNRVGKNSLGKKVTCITFINKKNAIVTTCDSCVRLISMNDGKNISKYRGYENEKSMIRASVDLSNDIIISGSENGCCYVWHIINEEGKKRKNYNYEYFQPFSKDIIECSIIIDEKCFVNYVKKVLKLTNKINVISVIINSTDNGKIEVLLNIDEENK